MMLLVRWQPWMLLVFVVAFSTRPMAQPGNLHSVLKTDSAYLKQQLKAAEDRFKADQDKADGDFKKYIKEIAGDGKEDSVHVQRYKGLGEMNAEQLWETTLNPETRTLKQVSIENAADADYIFSMLMGDEVPPRREFIETHATYAKIDV